MNPRRLVVASNRGPVGWSRDANGELKARRGAGGMIVALGGALEREPGTWVSVALSDGDREVAATQHGAVDVDGIPVRLLDVGDGYDAYYNRVANRLLWFTLHQLWAEPYSPEGDAWHDDWRAYRDVNATIGTAAAAEAGDNAEIHLHDYHLCVAGLTVRDHRPDAPLLHYLHTPWVDPSYLRRLPDAMVADLLGGLLAADVVAFSSPVWADAFRRCATAFGAARRDGDALVGNGRRTVVADFVLGVNAAGLQGVAEQPEAAHERKRIADLVGSRALIVRADRSDLSKNILRGLRAYRHLLDRHPEHRATTFHLALINPSRQDVPEYRSYLDACRAEADAIRAAHGDVLAFEVDANYPRVVAALQTYDVLLTNPVLDGTNLVAKEGPVLNQRNGALVLSKDAGAAAVLGDAALLVNPYDVDAQTAALHQALTMTPSERQTRASQLLAAASIGAPAEWLAAQREALARAVAARPRPSTQRGVGIGARLAGSNPDTARSVSRDEAVAEGDQPGGEALGPRNHD